MHRWSPPSVRSLTAGGAHEHFSTPESRLSLNLERTVKVDELYASIEANRPGRDDVVYLERRGDEYDWHIVPTKPTKGVTDASIHPTRTDKPEPDAWMSFTWLFPEAWPLDPERLRAFFDDLLAELESMAAGADRCRWPVDEPWPHFH
jgi:hypothetical protein